MKLSNIIGLGGLFFAGYSLYKNNRQAKSSDTPLPPPPGSGSGGSQSQNEDVPILQRNDPDLVAAVKVRVDLIFNNDREREAVYENAGVRSNIFAGLSYRDGIRSGLSQELASGNPNLIPVIPRSISTDYNDRLQLLTETEGMEALDARMDWAEVQSMWRGIADMGTTAGFSFWFPNLLTLIDSGFFYVSGSADRNKSERYDSWSTDVKRVAENLIVANEKAALALENAAIDQLRTFAGWRVEGFDFNTRP